MLDQLMKLALLPIGLMFIWSNKTIAEDLVRYRKIPLWMMVPARIAYAAGGVFAVGASLKLLFWP